MITYSSIKHKVPFMSYYLPEAIYIKGLYSDTTFRLLLG